MASRPDDFKGMTLTDPANRVAAGRVMLAQNVRAYTAGGFMLRNGLGEPIITVDSSVNSLCRMNDTTPDGPEDGYCYIIATDSGLLYVNSTLTAEGLSGNQVSIVTQRPNASVQPWAYIADSSPYVSFETRYAISDSTVGSTSNGMLKVRSDGLIYKAGIKEPQVAPTVSTSNSTTTGSVTIEGTQEPYTNAGGINTSWPFGGTQSQSAMTSIPIIEGQTITFTNITGTVTVEGTPRAFSDLVSNTADLNPGYWVYPGDTASSPLLMVAFTDGDGNIKYNTLEPTEGYIYGVGSIGLTLTAPPGTVQVQFGINTPDATIGTNTGSFDVSYEIQTSNIADYLAILSTLTLYYWGDSPTTGAVAYYIWRNPDDGGSGIERSSSSAVGTSTGNSFIFDATVTGGVPALPGIDITNGTDPTATAMQWSSLDENGNITGSTPVFSSFPSARPNGDSTSRIADFNFCLTGFLWVPQGGEYTLVLTTKDNCLLGIGGGASFVSGTGQWLTDNEGTVGYEASLPPGLGAPGNPLNGQTISVINGLPLMPTCNVSPGGGTFYDEGGQCTVSKLVISFPAAGVYPIELDFDYWYHSGRILLLQGSPTPGTAPAIIAPISSEASENRSYVYCYMSSLTGAISNPSPASTPIASPSTGAVVGSTWSPDPQVDKVVYYRQDSNLANYTLVGIGPNDNGLGGGQNTPIEDNLTDADVSSNSIVAYDNFEPAPSIDLPASGTCSVTGVIITRTGGTPFNLRWLPGTVIEIGSPAGQNPTTPQIAYSLISRPTSANSITLPGVQAGDNLVWNIPEPILANQPLPYCFGPTDNINYQFGVGDPLRPGTLYWCNGSNFDAWADTNQMDVTDPSEPLVNGAMSGGLGVLFSIKRAWVIYPNFFNALATVTGTQGSTWTLQDTSINRGLFIPRCVAVEGGGNIFFRVDDGIDFSRSGGASTSITDQDLYPLFVHEGSVPQPITRNGITIYPPDDSKPQHQRFSIQNGYLYYDHFGTDGQPHTWVFDIRAKGWVWDSYGMSQPTIHAANEGETQQGTLVGCSDGTVRLMSSEATEDISGVVLTAAIGGAGYMTAFQVTVEYVSDEPVELTWIAADVGNGSYPPQPLILPATGGEITKYTTKVSPAKWKLLQAQFAFSDPAAQVYLDGCVLQAKPWGSDGEYAPVPLFRPAGGHGGQP